MTTLKRSDFRFFHRMRVRWAEVDMQKIVFNAHYLMYFDTAISDYWRALCLPYQPTMDEWRCPGCERKDDFYIDESGNYECDKLIDVIHCFEHTPEDAVVRELALIKIKAEDAGRRTEILQIVEHFGGKTVDFGESSIIIRIEGASDKVDASIRLLNNYEIVETVRTGKVVMARGELVT